MDQTEFKAIALPHKFFAVITAPSGTVLYRKMWSMRLVGYLGEIAAIQGKGWDVFIKDAKVGQVWDVPIDGGSWMVLIRIRDDEDRGDTV